MLYRMSYEVAGRVASITFSAADLIAALSFQELWESSVGAKKTALKPIGESKFPIKVYQRLSHRTRELTKSEQFQLEISNG